MTPIVTATPYPKADQNGNDPGVSDLGKDDLLHCLAGFQERQRAGAQEL